eukprot:CAMPEP_0176065802 /NCGR_PEP_ID=MMETSP0120_2-20121206/32834_1 /TAXON_ID=160619 /ORGANISM="Kryptoperidinium foliaceum, Strain CCMP 1326" /LENGTH=325 /DNA_ID=CAMNT_0017399401 /DNA_START=43 /DNA_END=1016 /DNA_ORIENTATION=-
MSAVVARSSAPKSPPRGAYGAFILDRRVDLRNMMAVGMRKKSFFKVAAEAWRRLSSSGKEAYRRRAVEMRAEYEQQRAAATTGRTRDTEAFASLEPKASRQKPTAEEERPQRKKLLGVRGGYGVFCAERRQALKEEFKGKSGKHLIRRIAAEWRKQTAAQREAYAARYRDAKAKLEEHMATRRSWRQEASEDTIERPSTAPARAPAAAVHDDHPAATTLHSLPHVLPGEPGGGAALDALGQRVLRCLAGVGPAVARDPFLHEAGLPVRAPENCRKVQGEGLPVGRRLRRSGRGCAATHQAGEVERSLSACAPGAFGVCDEEHRRA